MDEQTSQPTEDRYSSRVDEPETDVEPDEEWFDDDADEDKLAQRNGRPANTKGGPKAALRFHGGGQSLSTRRLLFPFQAVEGGPVAAGSRPNTANARMTSPTPVRSSAIPTTMPKIEICSAM
jgi:hypothetical protein